jgi:deoxycytidylate deaminase
MSKNLLTQLESLARKSPMKHKFAAALVFRGKVISLGFNDYSGQTRCIRAIKDKNMKSERYHTIHTNAPMSRERGCCVLWRQTLRV